MGNAKRTAEETPETILQEAQRLVHGARQANYGHPFDDYTKVSRLWSVILDCDVSPQQAALCMVAIKISREMHMHKRDNLVDGAGYFAVLELIQQEADRRQEDESNGSSVA